MNDSNDWGFFLSISQRVSNSLHSTRLTKELNSWQLLIKSIFDDQSYDFCHPSQKDFKMSDTPSIPIHLQVNNISHKWNRDRVDVDPYLI